MRVYGLLTCILLIGCGGGGTVAPSQPWVVQVDTTAAGEPLNIALLGQYDLSGALYDYANVPGLITAMGDAGFSEWRIGAGRWEQGTQLLPMLTDGVTVCPATSGIFANPLAYSGDVDLVTDRDWFTDTSIVPDTNADSSYALDYLRSVIDIAESFGAEPFVSIDYMPSALSSNQGFNRIDCSTSFMNAVSNNRPKDNAVFASAVRGLVQRVVEGTGSKTGAERPRAVSYWEIWNEPEFRFFWEPGYAADPTIFFDMVTPALLQLDAYRTSSANPGLKFGLASFANSDNAIGTMAGYDLAAIPMDFISFHAYDDDPLVIVDKIAAVASAAQSSTNYQNIELALAEWGPDLISRVGDQTYAASIAPPLHAATVIALGAPAGLDRAHHAIFYDFHPNMALGMVDNGGSPKPLYRAYELMAKLITPGATRLAPTGLANGRIEAGMGAVLVSRDTGGKIRVLLVNRNTDTRSATVEIDGLPSIPSLVYMYDRTDDPTLALRSIIQATADIELPPESLVVVEF